MTVIDNEQRLFEELSRVAASKSLPPRAVWGASINLLINAILQSTTEHKTAEMILDQLMKNAKLILNVQYDPVTGKRRQVQPFTQVVEPPFVPSESTIFHGS